MNVFLPPNLLLHSATASPMAPATCQAAFLLRGYALGDNGRTAEAGALIFTHLGARGWDYGCVSGPLGCALRGNSRLRVSRKMGAFGDLEVAALFLFI